MTVITAAGFDFYENAFGVLLQEMASVYLCRTRSLDEIEW